MLPSASADQYRAQQKISTKAAASVRKLWRRMGDDFDASWAVVGPQVVNLVERARTASVATALPYTSRVLAETNQRDDATGYLSPEPFLLSAPDGRSIDSLYAQSVSKAKGAVGTGLSAAAAREQVGRWLTMVTLTTLADTRREVYAADIVQRPTLTGYVRMLNPPSCGRCVILAGKWFRWNEGFQRHPRCDCAHIPASENVGGDLRTDPYEYFKSLTPEQQEKQFGRIEARAIRDGADIYRVVNISGVPGSPGRGLATAKAARIYGTPSRLTIDDIYRQAGTRTNAIRMMREEGYILDRGQVAIARSPGVLTDTERLALGRGRGVITMNGQRITTNRAARFDAAQSGQRDVLNRSTMTAAERRLYDAHYRLEYALRNGTIPRAIGPSSSDRFSNPIPATPTRIAELETALRVQVSVLDKASTPESVRRVARALGLL